MNFIVIGTGARGTIYSGYIKENKSQSKIIAVADPDEVRRSRVADMHNISAENCFSDWRQIAARKKFADAVIIAIQDQMHLEPTLEFLKQGYHVLLEKPMASTVDECCRIYDAAKKTDAIFAVCHVLRYTAYTEKLKALLDAGIIGEIVSIEHLEPVGYNHQAHSYVRGHWRNSETSSPMLLAKSCHDLDWIRYIMGSKCDRITSFGNLMHFKEKNAPENSAQRCVDCDYEPQCPYSARKIYLKRAEAGDFDWPNRIITTDLTVDGVRRAIENGPYGRCVYRCDNDVVDHQVVNMLFENGSTASFTMTAFTKMEGRKTKIFGTKGCIEGDQEKITAFDFLTDKTTVIDTAPDDATVLGGHGGGDKRLIDAFIDAVESGDRKKILSGPEETLESHLMVFAAEKSRAENTIVDMTGFYKEIFPENVKG